MLAARQQQRVDHAVARDQRPAAALQLGIEKAEIERGVVHDERRVADEAKELLDQFGKARLVLEERERKPMDRKRLGGHVALGVEVAVECLSGRDAVEQFDAADLDQSMPLIGIEPGRLGVEHNFPHGFP